MQIAATDLLQLYAHSALQPMARARGHDIKGKGKDGLIELIAPTLYDPERIGRALADLTRVERVVLDRIVLLGGEAPTETLRKRLQGEHLLATDPEKPGWGYHQPAGSPWARGSNKFEDVVARLGILGLVFSYHPGAGGKVEMSRPAERLFIPDDILKHLPKATITPETIASPPIVRATDPAALLRDVYVLLSFAAEGGIPLTGRGQIAKRTLVQIDGSLRLPEQAASVRSEDELGRLPLLRALAEDLGLLVAREGVLAFGDQAREFLSQPAGERRQRLYRAFAETPRWCELFRIGDVTVSTRGVGKLAPPLAIAARRRVLAELAKLPAGQWVPLAHLIDRLRQGAYEFLLSRHQPQNRYYYGYGVEPNPYTSSNLLSWTFPDIRHETSGWDRVEAGFIRVIVVEALHWLGLVDLGELEGKVAAFRITTDGARLLDGAPLPSSSAAPHVVVQPNFQIFVFEPTGEDVLFRLDQFAERVRVEQVIEYRLTRESVYRAERAGIEAAAVVAYLDQITATPLPQNVRRTLEEWGAHHERIVVRRGVALAQVVDEATLDSLAADPEIGQLLGNRIAPTAALVPFANLAPLYRRLLERSRLPVLTEGLDDLPGPLLTVDNTGRIAFRHRLPSLFVRHAVSRVADEQPDGTIRLSSASLRRAARAGLTPDQVIAALARWHIGPLPPAVPALVRRWTKDWGRGALVAATLLQVERADVLSDLLADPEVGPHLEPVPDAPNVAIVRGEGAEAVRSSLESRGMALESRLLR